MLPYKDLKALAGWPETYSLLARSLRGAAAEIAASRGIITHAIIGRVGAIKKVGTTTRVTIASNYPFRDTNGEWRDQTSWNEIVIFSKNIEAYINKHLANGDLIHARGRIRQSSYEHGEERAYTVDLICNQFARLAQAAEKPEASPEPAEPLHEDIPF